MDKEIFKDIPRYKNYYQASNFGRVKSLERVIVDNRNIRIIKERILKYGIIGNGYCAVVLSKNGENKQFLIHRLVLLAFLGESTLCCNHKDCNKLNNNLENLEYCNYQQNAQHAWENGRYKRVINARKKRIKQYDLKNIFIKTFNSITEASRETKINHTCISSCLHGKQKTAGDFRWEFAL